MATYLVTGAAGFIAARVCELLVGSGHTVVGIDNFDQTYSVQLKNYRIGQLLLDDSWKMGADHAASAFNDISERKHGNFVFRRVDIEDVVALERLFSAFEFDAVFNLAGRGGVRASVADPAAYLRINTGGTLNVLEVQRKAGVKKHVLASTSSVYAGYNPPFHEEMAANRPLSPYAASKRAAELMALVYHQLHGLDITVLRYFTVFGPAGRPDMALFRFVASILSGRPVTVNGNGSQTRDFTYVDDIATGTILAARPLGFATINLGGGREPVSLLDIIGEIERATGRPATIAFRSNEAADVSTTNADVAKAKEVLGWIPEFSVREGLRRTVDWHIANRDWISGIAE